jgi:transposase
LSWSAEAIAPCARWRQDSAFLTRRRNWIKAADKSEARAADPNALSESERGELKRSRKENAELKQDREILLKASAFFAKETSR